MEYLNAMTNYYEPLEPDAFYHIYNRGNNRELIFFEKRNYNYFLNKLGFYLEDYLNFYAYALLPNHFHFLVQVKTIHNSSKLVSEQFRRFFLSYSKSIKIQEGRTGSLFEKNFKRKRVEDQKHLLWLINYIHRNPETHNITNNFSSYPYSSYQSILSGLPTKLKRLEVLNWFGGIEEFIRFHESNPVQKDPDIPYLADMEYL